ncbi:hypothetical protein NLX83_07430 [Allokutzneria sp. A3M-2-11 16]|uniref:hypothetical protein n=1 Tax=Allokutzneria sp. A3M-2-11 16 TaxID=2962043 RepID=UPI0020B7C886|nr:hypothetical protein [Allokutzneria sp. A3M-2-11 16]MCP3799083.1 hypothetical protein [Allokutzneria sp. A3M-2-11 16]
MLDRLSFDIAVRGPKPLKAADREVNAILTVSAHPLPRTAEVIVFDRSNRAEFGAVKAHVLSAIDAVADGLEFAVVAGSTTEPDGARLVVADQRTRAAAKAAVGELGPEGDAEFASWLGRAAVLLAEHEGPHPRAMLITAGTRQEFAAAAAPYVDRFVCNYVGPDSATEGVEDGIHLNLSLPPNTRLRFLRQISPQQADLADDAGPLGYNTGTWGAESREYHLCVEVPPPMVREFLAARVTLVRLGEGGEPIQLAHANVLARLEIPLPPLFAPPAQQQQPPPKHKAPARRVDGRGGGATGGFARPRPPNVVNTGFADAAAPLLPLPQNYALRPGWGYWFWLDVGPLVGASIEAAPMSLPQSLPADAQLTVVLYGFPGEFDLDPRAATGVLQMNRDGSPRVLRQPSIVEHTSRLFFPVRTPHEQTPLRLRCNIYWQQELIQSRLITATPGELKSTVDFRIADPHDVLRWPSPYQYSASLLLNDDGRGTHALRVLAKEGADVLRAEASITSHQLTSAIRMARGALSRVAWGSEEPWREEFDYRYGSSPTVEQVTNDLITLAVNGYRLHHVLVRALGRSVNESAYSMADRVGAALGAPGFVQIALKEGAQHVIPAAMVYDLPLDSNAPDLVLCQDFLTWASRNEIPLSPCLRRQCGQALSPSPTVVCPGGFWGFRHALGLPVSLGAAPAVPPLLPHDGGVRLVGGVYQDFASTAAHRDALRNLLPWKDYRLGEDRESTLAGLQGDPQIVYFYCHGGVSGEVPFLQVGKRGGPAITPDNLHDRRVRWSSSRPLVVLNGCRTTDLEPERAIDFVSFFVEEALACGVIGTEVTVFEQMAHQFAEEVLRGFLVHGEPIGAAVTRARVALLANGNPLGLAYIPFVSPTIRMAPLPAP